MLEKIVSGEWPEGTRLPTSAQMAQQLEVSINAIQTALSRLAARGFVTRRAHYGTVIHRHHAMPENLFLLVGPCLREEACHYDRRLSRLLEEELVTRGYQPLLYDNLNQIFDPQGGKRLLQQLLNDLAHFAPVALVEQDFSLLRVPTIANAVTQPVVSLGPWAQGCDLSFDYPRFLEEAVRATVEAGGRRALLVLKTPKIQFENEALRAFWEAARAHGLTVVDLLTLEDHRRTALEEEAQALVATALRERRKLPPGKRFDTLIFMDDILARAAALALLREGAAEEVRIVTLVNEGVEITFGVPVIGIQTPLGALARDAADLLEIRLGRLQQPSPAPLLAPGEPLSIP